MAIFVHSYGKFWMDHKINSVVLKIILQIDCDINYYMCESICKIFLAIFVLELESDPTNLNQKEPESELQ